MSTSPPVRGANNHAKRGRGEHQNFRKLKGSQNANQHGDPHSPPETRDNCPLQIGKTKGISRPLLLCGLNQWIGRSHRPRRPSGLYKRVQTVAKPLNFLTVHKIQTVLLRGAKFALPFHIANECLPAIVYVNVLDAEKLLTAITQAPMSALGQKRTWRSEHARSALPPKAAR